MSPAPLLRLFALVFLAAHLSPASAQNETQYGDLAQRVVSMLEEEHFLREPFIVISASGMMENGRVLHHLRNRIEDPKNNFPTTWEELFAVGKTLKEMGKPLGQALGHDVDTGDLGIGSLRGRNAL